MNQIPTLEDSRARLEPLNLDNYHRLSKIASQPNLIAFSPSDISTPAALENYVKVALDKQRRKEAFPFAIFDKQSGKYAGCTRYMHIGWGHKVLHIGATWIGKEFQGSGLNTHVKVLMLDHAFGEMNFRKVEFRVDERNLRSRKAVEKMGGILEGILRKDIIMLDGFYRSTCCYGILREEWAELRKTTFKKIV